MGPEVKQRIFNKLSPDWHDWGAQLRHRIETAVELQQFFPELTLPDFSRLSEQFRFGATPYYLGLADPADPDCPILRQAIPDPREISDELFSQIDPLAEETHMPLPGLTHRYPDRALWYLSHNCAVYCRFCMRKRKVGQAQSAGDPLDEKILKYITDRTEIKEVILSGGDPLSLSDEKLDQLFGRLRRIDHLYSIRIHTRMPVTLPFRITEDFAAMLGGHYPVTIVTHFNCAREITEESAESVKRLRFAGVLVLNQTVLLRGINDTTEKMEKLLLNLLRVGVKPYYLHQCDEVRGVGHFRVPLKKGLQIIRELRGRNPGIALPVYVVDLPGGGGKVPVENNYIKNGPNGRLTAQNWAGNEYQILSD